MRCLISLSFLFHLGNTQAWKGAPSSSREVEGGAASLSTASSIVVKLRQAWTTHLPLRMTSKRSCPMRQWEVTAHLPGRHLPLQRRLGQGRGD